jgi:hypothetical protein
MTMMPKGVEQMPRGVERSIVTEYPIFVTSAWGKSPRMVADEFAADHWAIPHRVSLFRSDGTFCLEGGTTYYRVASQPGVPGVSEATCGVFRVSDEEAGRCG